jgi:AcrR family transcriptional regulator
MKDVVKQPTTGGEGDGRTERASRQRKNRRGAILRAARPVFASKGYHQTHVSDIIDAAGIARGTFYLYFDSKAAIFIELLELSLDELRGAIVGVDQEPESPPVEVQLAGTVRRILNTVVSNRLLTTILVREAVGLDEEVDRRLKAFYKELIDYIRDALEEGKRIGILRGIDTEVGAFCIMGTIKQFMEQLVMYDREIPTEDVDRLALAVLDFNLRGVLKT